MIEQQSLPPELSALQSRVAELNGETEAAAQRQDYEAAARIKSELLRLQTEYTEQKAALDSGRPTSNEVTEADIAELIGSITGIPVSKMLEGESDKLLNMEERLHERVIGQEPAIAVLSDAIRRARAGLRDPRRPIGSFIFLGPTGVGKTELAKTLAEFLFDDEDALIQLDMSEFGEKHTASRLFGSPPGYVGYEEGGQLTEKVRRKPFSVVLFDEVEKAHPDIFNSLLQILEEGRLTDSQGRVVDFKNTVIIMTTNLGTRDIAKSVHLGFNQSGDAAGSYERMKGKVTEELKQHFRPEFLNRVDDIVVFRPLGTEQIARIVDLQLARLDKLLADRKITLEVTPEAKHLLAEEGYDPALGARPLKRSIQRLIQNPLAMAVLEGKFGDGDAIVVRPDGKGALEFSNEPARETVGA
ncbi:MAG: AAA family ATPase [Gemmatimonadales bacterium]